MHKERKLHFTAANQRELLARRRKMDAVRIKRNRHLLVAKELRLAGDIEKAREKEKSAALLNMDFSYEVREYKLFLDGLRKKTEIRAPLPDGVLPIGAI
jgi:hypothetical protein